MANAPPHTVKVAYLHWPDRISHGGAERRRPAIPGQWISVYRSSAPPSPRSARVRALPVHISKSPRLTTSAFGTRDGKAPRD
jgi:hypothetical protein